MTSVKIGDTWWPTVTELDGVVFWLAFDANGKPFYTDIPS